MQLLWVKVSVNFGQVVYESRHLKIVMPTGSGPAECTHSVLAFQIMIGMGTMIYGCMVWGIESQTTTGIVKIAFALGM
jgi:hypothetical protein